MSIHPFLKKMNKRKYDYATLAECFDILDDLIDWDKKSRRTIAETDYRRKTEMRSPDRGISPPSLLHVVRWGHRDKQASLKARQYTAMNTAINNILHNIKEKSKHPNKYCSFHNATKSYLVLRDLIEKLLDQRHCWEFIKDKVRKQDQQNPRIRIDRTNTLMMKIDDQWRRLPWI